MLTLVINCEVCVKGLFFISFFSALLMCSSNANLTSSGTPRCLLEDTCKTLFLLKIRDGYGSFFIFKLKITSGFFTWVSVKIRFPMESPYNNLFQVII